MRFQSWAASHPGAVRSHNEDSFVDRSDIGLWAVADGAGGHDAGEVASGLLKQALDAIPPALSASELLAQVRLRVGEVHQALREEAQKRSSRTVIASTLVVLLARDGHFACLWAGDSRVYLLRDGALSQVTRDHSLVQELVDAGTITAEEADGHPRANVITRAVGAAETMELDKVSNRLVAGDRFLLCSDGLSKTLADAELAELLADPGPAERLIAEALARRASDNITVVAVEAF
ncbi:MAG: serine/threonine-protein phosphatase [Acetobacteraceae bacterium]|nr:serine/threonine-protein phosphatase [Acetobacteraceae bacterium]